MRRSSTLLCALLLLVLCFSTPPLARAQKRRELPGLVPAPPPVVPQRVTVEPGQAVQVPLTIIGGRAEQLEFLIRVPPRAGKLSQVRPVGANGGVVTYQAPARAGEDRFSYAVRSREGVSAAAMVSIVIAGAPAAAGLAARLVVPESVDFPSVFPGELSSAELEVHNVGATMAEGTLTLPAMWSTESGARYRIAAGGRAVFKLTFTPTRAGIFNDDAILGPSPKKFVPLHAVVEAPLVLKPAALKLAPAAGQPARSAVFLLENRTGEEQTVKVSAGTHLLVPESVKIGARETAQVAVTADASAAGEFADKLKLSTETWSAELPVHVLALAATVRFGVPPEFGAVLAGASVSAKATLVNPGEVAANVTLRAEGAFAVESAKLTVPPHDEARVGVALREARAGVNRGKIIAEWDGGREELALSVTAAEPVRVAAKQAPKPDAEEPAAAESEEITDPLLAMTRAEHPNGLGDFTRDLQPTSAVLEWPSDLGATTALRLEERVLSLGKDDELVVKWQPLGGVTFSAAGALQRAELHALKPDALYTVRVVSGAKDTVFTAEFITPAKKPLVDIGWQTGTLSLLALGLLVAGWLRWKSRERSAW